MEKVREMKEGSKKASKQASKRGSKTGDKYETEVKSVKLMLSKISKRVLNVSEVV